MYGRMERELRGRSLLLCVDGASRILKAGESGLVLGRAPSDAAVVLRTTRDVLVDLLEGRRTLVDSAMDEAFEVRGAPDDVLASFDALAAFLHGAVRSPSMPRLLESYTAGAP